MEGTPEEIAPADHVTDRTLVAAFRRGAPEAFRMLVHRHVPAVYALIRMRLTASGDVDDVLQQVFTHAWQKLDVKRMPGESALPWMLSLAQQKVSNANRSRTRRRPTARTAPTLAFELAAGTHELKELSTTLEAAVERLGPTDAEIVCRCLVHGETYKEAVRSVRPGGGVLRTWLSGRRQAAAPLGEDEEG